MFVLFFVRALTVLLVGESALPRNDSARATSKIYCKKKALFCGERYVLVKLHNVCNRFGFAVRGFENLTLQIYRGRIRELQPVGR